MQPVALDEEDRRPLWQTSAYLSLSIFELGSRLAVATTDEDAGSHITRVYGSG